MALPEGTQTQTRFLGEKQMNQLNLVKQQTKKRNQLKIVQMANVRQQKPKYPV
jgi:hypothetical protein